MKPTYPDFDPARFMEALTLGQIPGYCLADLFDMLEEETDLELSSGRAELDAALRRIYDAAKERFELEAAIQGSDCHDL